MPFHAVCISAAVALATTATLVSGVPSSGSLGNGPADGNSGRWSQETRSPANASSRWRQPWTTSEAFVAGIAVAMAAVALFAAMVCVVTCRSAKPRLHSAGGGAVPRVTYKTLEHEASTPEVPEAAVRFIESGSTPLNDDAAPFATVSKPL